MEPTISINYLAILVCTVVGILVGFIWFGPLFGKQWAAHMGMSDAEPPKGGAMTKNMINFTVACFLIAYVLAHSVDVWRQWAGDSATPTNLALNTGFFTWIGFFVPLQMTRATWEGKKWGLVAINAGHDLVRLLVFAFILAYWT